MDKVMNKHIKTIRKYLADFKNTEDSWALELRMDFAEALIKELNVQRLTLDVLSEKTGIKKKNLKKIIQSDYNFKINEIAKIGHAIGLKFIVG